VQPCPYCHELIQPDALICRFCARVVPHYLARIHTIGRNVILGATVNGEYALWRVDQNEPFAAWPTTEQGWQQASLAFATWEQQSRSRTPYVGLILILAFFAVLYVAYHSYRYHGCLVQPGLFSWPAACL
jgi:hypothetical protein